MTFRPKPDPNLLEVLELMKDRRFLERRFWTVFKVISLQKDSEKVQVTIYIHSKKPPLYKKIYHLGSVLMNLYLFFEVVVNVCRAPG